MTSYMHALMKAHALGLIRPGEVAHVDIAHDTGCPALKRGACACACTPDICLIRGSEVIRISDDGTVEQEGRTQ